jgi:hypothetical protein
VKDKSMALKRRLQAEDRAQELILESDSDAHIYEVDISPPQSDSDEDRTTQDAETGPTFSTFCTCNTQFTGGGGSGLRQNEAPHINKDSSRLSVFMFFFS